MQVSSSASRSSVRVSERKGSEVSGLRKSEIIADIFNHRPDDSGAKRDVRVYLSHASRALNAEFHGEVSAFLKQNPKIEKNLSRIELSGEGWERVRPEQLIMRRLVAYVNWLKIREHCQEEFAVGDQNDVYMAIHSEGQDERIKVLVAANDARREAVETKRKRYFPNYYYMMYPETYAFN